MKYLVTVSVNIYPLEDDGQLSNASSNALYASSNALYHQQTFEISGSRFSDIAPTIDTMYDAIQQTVEASHGNHH